MTDYGNKCRENGVVVDAALDEQWREAKKSAEILSTEEYFVRQIENAPANLENKLNKRQGQVATLFPYELVHEKIRERVRQITGI